MIDKYLISCSVYGYDENGRRYIKQQFNPLAGGIRVYDPFIIRENKWATVNDLVDGKTIAIIRMSVEPKDEVWIVVSDKDCYLSYIGDG